MNGLKPGWFGISGLGAGVACVAYLNALPPAEVRLSGFATRLDGRTRAQRHNAELAARSLNGKVIAPGASFSFNDAVQGWSLDRGYVRAPVSFDGELIPAFGGGVCQTSTTLYNAALLGGMAVTERHHHVFAPHYVAPGRDAAVAYPSLDLRMTNPYPFAVRIRSQSEGGQLRVELWGKEPLRERYTILSRVLSRDIPELQRRTVPSRRGNAKIMNRQGATGFRVVTYRVRNDGSGETRTRERLSDDSYPSMPGVVRVASSPP